MKPSLILKKNLMLSDLELGRYLTNCSRRYKKYPIQKRSGGVRIIAQPTADLKVAQRVLLNEFLIRGLPVHSAAMAYKPGSSIGANARLHSKNSFLLKMDFKDFFPSITDTDLCSLLVASTLLDKTEIEELKIISRIFFMYDIGRHVLSIGAPSSPFISNAILFKFDEIIAQYCASNSIVYSRYSDDLSFSTSKRGVLFEVPRFVKGVLAEIQSPSLTINDDKTVFSSKAHNRHITGVTLTNEGGLSIGHQKKRSIRTRVFLFSQGALDADSAKSLQGYISFVYSVDPTFVRSLYLKYPLAMPKLMSLGMPTK